MSRNTSKTLNQTGTPASGGHRVGRNNQRLWQDVVSSLLNRIVAGEFPAGSVMPAEAELAEAYGVSRPSIRDAVKILQERGLIRVQHGVGSVVQSSTEWSVLDPELIAARMEHDTAGYQVFDDLSVVRIALESELAAAAATRIDADAIARLTEHMALMDAATGDPDRYLELDVAFHGLVIDLAGNQMATAIMNSIQEPLRQSRRLTNRIPKAIESAHGFHHQIFDKLVIGDSAGAGRTMREHLQWSWAHHRKLRPH
ncbi:FadR/GntR family transcriptional regulator [Streptomyces sioyaensis]|uniref:FadR/GntR family transcriptional regulator n=1 Tax=Streptomyces sioyaensis TaxID=67364 RepID=UPI003D73B8B4